jgi:signal transduction histidine kinase
MNLEQTGRLLRREVFPSAPRVMKEIESSGKQVEDILEIVRQLSLELRPPMLDEMGLLPALLTYVDKFRETTGAQIDFRHSGLYKRLDGATEKALYRMVQEGLTNVVRHSGTKEASVRILLDEKRLVAQVRDQGKGFDADIILNERLSTGLSGMSERIALCGGELTIESEPGKGTCLTAEFLLEAVLPDQGGPTEKGNHTTHADE